ncbi:MAG: HNH endonuclease [bacterium]|nr:HNH endonuclease [bacterium]
MLNFYKSDSWKLNRELSICSVNGRCERCGGIGQEVHHTIRLTVENVSDGYVSVNQDNLYLLCKDCHNKRHKKSMKEMQFF